jgi:hypothetical protein
MVKSDVVRDVDHYSSALHVTTLWFLEMGTCNLHGMIP